MWKPGWYAPIEKKLEPMTGLVIAGLLAIVLFSVWVLVKGDSIQKTSWLVYLISP